MYKDMRTVLEMVVDFEVLVERLEVVKREVNCFKLKIIICSGLIVLKVDIFASFIA